MPDTNEIVRIPGFIKPSVYAGHFERPGARAVSETKRTRGDGGGDESLTSF